MAETFYGVLGVADDADSQTIEAAYREQVKEAHPDVSDDPRAEERFRRLTTAREVLVDADERARYDRLGHTAYVERHVDSSVWTAETPRTGTADATVSQQGEQTTATTDGRGRTRTPPGERTAWLGDDYEPDRSAASATATTEEGWQQAAGPYRSVDTAAGGTGRGIDRAEAVRRIGPWLPFHAVFLLSAFATGWFVVTGAGYLDLSMPALVGSLIVLVAAICTSVVHLMTRLYT